MRVGLYVDGFNLYYAGCDRIGKNSSGWKWLDLRALGNRYAQWKGAKVTQVVYCTAQVNDPAAAQRHDIYLKALRANNSVDVIEKGYFSSWSKEFVMTNEAAGQKNPTPVSDPTRSLTWSSAMHIRHASSNEVLATVRKREEKGSDVNVATHLLNDVLTGSVDAAIVLSNDSDLALPIKVVRNHVPVGVLNPSKKPYAGALTSAGTTNHGKHWRRRMTTLDWQQCQMPTNIQNLSKPPQW